MSQPDKQQTTAEEPEQFTATVRRRDFARYLAVPNAVADEAIIRITDEGLATRAVDPANVAMASVELGTESVREWSSGEHDFGVNTRKLTSLVEQLDTDELTLEFDPNQRKLDLVSGPYRYTHSCIDPASMRSEPTIPDMELDFDADLSAQRFRSVIAWIDEFSTHWRIGFDPDDGRFWVTAMERGRNGDVKTDDGCFELDASELGYISEWGAADSQFSMDYTRDMLEALPEDGKISVRIGQEFPILLSFDFAGGHGEAQFLQAPRIVSD